MLAKLANFQRVSLQIQNVDSRSITQLLQNLRKDLIHLCTSQHPYNITIILNPLIVLLLPLFLKTKDDFTGNDKGLFIL